MKEIQLTDKLTLTAKGQEVWSECAPQYRYIINKIIDHGLEYSELLPTFMNEKDYLNIMGVADYHLRLDQQQRIHQQTIKRLRESRKHQRESKRIS